MQTANHARNLISKLDALASAVGAAPDEKVVVKKMNVKQGAVKQGEATALCTKCNRTCHERCYIFEDSKKAGCASMRNGYCIYCQCCWTEHKNTQFILFAEEVSEWVTPEKLLNDWNTYNNTLEGKLLSAMDEYAKLQRELKNDILYLAELTEKLTNTALRHNPAALINYVETLIVTAAAQGALPEHVAQLIKAKNMLRLANAIKESKESTSGSGECIDPTSGSTALLVVMEELRTELKKRMKLNSKERAAEESKPCNLYNTLRERLPKNLRDKAPKRLKTEGQYFGKGALYLDNLKAIVKLVQLVLSDGGIVDAFGCEPPAA
ncbi:hypothetical protein PI124_g23745 [Phytophthora idaei]|nr:hypothetical protein PI125_g25942 [Phytophthora idaei]KAG3123397.1 hypothetical protein PI126_g23730 [Phytophthora idaei]KAG3231160.1 hypothetical protein PI124_g23745 [Phytophthora idaei]